MRPLKRYWRKHLRRSQRQLETISVQAEDSIERHLFRRFENLFPVRRFVIGWVGLIIVLIGAVFIQNLDLSDYYQSLGTIPGGIYREGVMGIYSNANPIYANSDANNTVSSLIFAGLLKLTPSGNLVGDLASSYSVDSSEKVYTVNLKPNLKWQDGQPLTSKDVVFTFDTIENPDASSPLFSSWSGIQVSAPSPTTVIFKLPDVLASFPYQLTTGIIPEHILGAIAPSDLASANFNTINPVGAGPFEWQAIQVTNANDPENEEVQIALKPFSSYNGGMPKLDQFVVNIFADEDQLVSAFNTNDLTGIEADTPPPSSVEYKKGVVIHNFTLRAANMVFFKTSTGLLADSNVREALVEGANVPDIISHLGYPTKEVNEPLLIGQLAYNSSYAQAKYNPTAAETTLETDGWSIGSGGIRDKSGQPLTFTLTAANTPENAQVANELKQQWSKIGVNLNVQLLDTPDFLSALSTHSYDAVMTAISVGVDPDVFVYWDSAEADIRSTYRLNFSEYNNPNADESLQAGRTRLNPLLRVIKYEPFLQAWQQDNPALGLYQPRLLYLTNGLVGGLPTSGTLSSSTDRFYNVQNWEVRQARITHKS